MYETKPVILEQGDALVIVDMQNDFLPGGALPVPDGDKIIPIINQTIARFDDRNFPIFATRDWHPSDHQSFDNQGGIWPPHCIAGTQGAKFAPNLNQPESLLIIAKGEQRNCPGYSGFEHTMLEKLLRSKNIKRIFVCGLATDYCVMATVCDALTLGFQIYVLADAIKAVNVKPDDGFLARQQMQALGAIFISLEQIA